MSSLLDTKFSNEYDVSGGGTDTSWKLTMKPLVEKDLEQKTVAQAIETIRDRVDALGVSEPLIAPYSLGANQVLVELPGVSDLDKVEIVLKSTARLEVHPVVGDGQGFQDEQAALASVNGALPPDEYIVHCQGDMACHGSANTVYILGRAPVVSGTDFRSADPSVNSNTGQQIVRFTLTDEAGDRFWDYTNANVGKYMAIVMGGNAREVAVIKSGIRDTRRNRGLLHRERSRRCFRSCCERARFRPRLVFLENRTVGASLGADSIRDGVTAADHRRLRGDGLHAHLLQELGHQCRPGAVPEPGHSARLPWLLWVHAHLAGHCGVILTIGMGVDSNVLIFERIREEIRAGKAASAAVDQGFAHAWVTIVDTHVTTIVSAAMLFIVGTGPVRGFAITLVFGLLANLFTAVYVSRVIFEAHLNKLKPGEMISI